ncbi:hypothetical protein SLE2022_210290 [Rubroshorea leprosula]
MHIEVYKYPAWSDVIEIEIWFQGEGRIGTRRDWILNDFATGQVIGRATCKWVMMNQDTLRRSLKGASLLSNVIFIGSLRISLVVGLI